MRIALIAALALGAGCIDKPDPPGAGGDGDGGPGDGDGGIDAGGDCAATLGPVTAWTQDDQIRFDRDQGNINPDCLEDLVIPGVRNGAENVVFVVLGRGEEMLVGGYDSFVDTGAREPIDVKLAKLVGQDEVLDLVVLSHGESDGGDESTFVRVYRGLGDGTFMNAFVENEIAGLALQIGDFDSPEPLYIEPLRMDEGKPTSLVFGDANTTRTLSPTSWNDSDAVADVEEQPIVSDGEATTSVFSVPSAREDEVDDLVRLTQGQMQWNANQGPSDYAGAVEVEDAVGGIGRAALRDVNDDGYPDIAYSRNELVWVTLLTGGIGAGASGEAEELTLDPQPAFGDTLNLAFEDIQVAQLDGDPRGDLVLVEGGPGSGSFLWVYPNLAESGAFAVNASDHVHVDVAPPVTGFFPNRAFVGRFSDSDAVDVWVVGSKPSEVPPICLRVSVDDDETTQELCD